MPAVSVPATRWRSCAPTPRAVVAVFPWVSLGGAEGSCGLFAVAARVESPWHAVQPLATTSTLSTDPFMWSAGLTEVAV